MVPAPAPNQLRSPCRATSSIIHALLCAQGRSHQTTTTNVGVDEAELNFEPAVQSTDRTSSSPVTDHPTRLDIALVCPLRDDHGEEKHTAPNTSISHTSPGVLSSASQLSLYPSGRSCALRAAACLLPLFQPPPPASPAAAQSQAAAFHPTLNPNPRSSATTSPTCCHTSCQHLSLA